MEDGEADYLDRAYDVKPVSRLGCQARLDDQDVVYQITEGVGEHLVRRAPEGTPRGGGQGALAAEK